MVTVMETSQGRILDEACNHYNDVYRDELLYAAWTGASSGDAEHREAAAPAAGEPAGVAALYACPRQRSGL
jgi:hypothetical protein